jgi:hypothetical protein
MEKEDIQNNENEKSYEEQWEEAVKDYLEELEDLGWDWDAYEID